MIETERLKLIPFNQLHFEAALESEEKLAELLGVRLAEGWLHFPESIAGGYAMLKQNAQNLRWGMRLFVHKADNKLIGIGGFKGAVDENGMVEIGYAIAPAYQNQGLATEAARGMIDYSFSHSSIKMVDAHTLAEENASVKVLRNLGMKKIGELHDPDDGDIWHWRISREEY